MRALPGAWARGRVAVAVARGGGSGGDGERVVRAVGGAARWPGAAAPWHGGRLCWAASRRRRGEGAAARNSVVMEKVGSRGTPAPCVCARCGPVGGGGWQRGGRDTRPHSWVEPVGNSVTSMSMPPGGHRSANPATAQRDLYPPGVAGVLGARRGGPSGRERGPVPPRRVSRSARPVIIRGGPRRRPAKISAAGLLRRGQHLSASRRRPVAVSAAYATRASRASGSRATSPIRSKWRHAQRVDPGRSAPSAWRDRPAAVRVAGRLPQPGSSRQ